MVELNESFLESVPEIFTFFMILFIELTRTNTNNYMSFGPALKIKGTSK
jgi:hypothetical protein